MEVLIQSPRPRPHESLGDADVHLVELLHDGRVTPDLQVAGRVVAVLTPRDVLQFTIVVDVQVHRRLARQRYTCDRPTWAQAEKRNFNQRSSVVTKKEGRKYFV